MLELMQLKPTDKLLEIGTGSGYQTEIWSKYCKEIHSIELKRMCDPARLTNAVYLHEGDGAKGIPGEAPFDCIVATCGVRNIPDQWEAQLSENEGRLVVPIGSPDSQRLTLYIKSGKQLRAEKIAAYCRFMMMENPDAL